MATKVNGLIEKIQIPGAGVQSIASTAYGYCETIASEAAKMVDMTGFELYEGVTIHIKFKYENSASNPTLNVQSTGAIPIVQYDAVTATNINETDTWPSGAVLSLTYDGTNWVREWGYGLTDSLAWTNITNKPTTIDGYGITDAEITSGTITLGSNTITPIINIAGLTGNTITSSDLITNLGLSNAIHFIGVVASDSTNTPSDGTNSIPTITGLSSYTPAAGDIIIDKDNLREYIWSNNAWILLGFTTSTEYDSNSIIASTASTDASNPDTPTWISRITQATDGKISIERQTIGILSTSHGGTGQSSWTQYGILYASNSTTLAQITAGASENEYQPLISNGAAAPDWYAGLILTGSGTQQSPYDATFSNTVTITGAATLSSTLSVTGTSQLIGNVGIGASSDNIYKLYINGDTLFNGNLIPTLSNDTTPAPNKILGSSNNRWAALYIGTSDSYGDVYTPIYWNNGVPAEVTPTQRLDFEFNTTNTSSISFTSSAITLNTEVSQIVVTSGISYLNSEITWTVAANSNSVPTLTLSATTNIPLDPANQKIEGYIILAHTANITSTASIVSNI